MKRKAGLIELVLVCCYIFVVMRKTSRSDARRDRDLKSDGDFGRKLGDVKSVLGVFLRGVIM